MKFAEKYNSVVPPNKRDYQKKVGTPFYPLPFHLSSFLHENCSPSSPSLPLYGPHADFQLFFHQGPSTSIEYTIFFDSEVWCWQFSGNLHIRFFNAGKLESVTVEEGECYLLPKNIPHSLVRPEGAAGLMLVANNKNPSGNFCVYCDQCSAFVMKTPFQTSAFESERIKFRENLFQQTNITCPVCENIIHHSKNEGNKATDNFCLCSKDEYHKFSICKDTHPDPLSFSDWVESNKKYFLPPVGNKMMFNHHCYFKIMCVGGPNIRTDYHFQEGEEWFYMLRGNMNLKIIDHGKFRDIIIKEGESFLLPAYTYHSPQRKKDTIGLVIERERGKHEVDRLAWFCRSPACLPKSHPVEIFEQTFYCEDLGAQLIPVIKKYYGNESLRKCPECGIIDSPIDF